MIARMASGVSALALTQAHADWPRHLLLSPDEQIELLHKAARRGNIGFPISQWNSIRTSNAIERLHEEFKRRIKTQTVLPSEERPIKTRQSRSSSATRFPDQMGF